MAAAGWGGGSVSTADYGLPHPRRETVLNAVSMLYRYEGVFASVVESGQVLFLAMLVVAPPLRAHYRNISTIDRYLQYEDSHPLRAV